MTRCLATLHVAYSLFSAQTQLRALLTRLSWLTWSVSWHYLTTKCLAPFCTYHIYSLLFTFSVFYSAGLATEMASKAKTQVV